MEMQAFITHPFRNIEDSTSTFGVPGIREGIHKSHRVPLVLQPLSMSSTRLPAANAGILTKFCNRNGVKISSGRSKLWRGVENVSESRSKCRGDLQLVQAVDVVSERENAIPMHVGYPNWIKRL